jgi:hypothetical protein
MRAIFLPAALFATLMLQAASASADIKLCNQWGNEIWATYGNISQGSYNRNSRIYGWYRIQPGQCATVISGCACNFWASLNNNCYWQYVVFAKDASGRHWGTEGGANLGSDICTTYNGFSEDPQIRWENGSCPAPRNWINWIWGSLPDDSLGWCNYTINFR